MTKVALPFRSSKNYPPSRGLSCTFRQWRAIHSHCSQFHGYSLGVGFDWGTDKLDSNNWVVDFGMCKSLWESIQEEFDHKTLIAEDDPVLPLMRQVEAFGASKINVVPATGCEMFAHYIHANAVRWMKQEGLSPRVVLIRTRVWEHESNSGEFWNPEYA